MFLTWNLMFEILITNHMIKKDPQAPHLLVDAQLR